ncbi:hypothetical protein J2Z81_001314 [Virgibacillus campisalis]|uniref:Uncharacterized protein n=1 Tax=Virgibacillus alimentarius TaxID=698769 RepID=A0ABS4S7A6_9BACI|nr:hypothetical protein [Virgibacillus alimentarius]
MVMAALDSAAIVSGLKDTEGFVLSVFFLL